MFKKEEKNPGMAAVGERGEIRERNSPADCIMSEEGREGGVSGAGIEIPSNLWGRLW